MVDNEFSLSALYMAYIRDFHCKHDNPKIFNDFLAGKLVPEEAHNIFEQAMIFLDSLGDDTPRPEENNELDAVIRARTGLPVTVSRSRYTEDTLEEAVEDGVKQYVILGAGMDTFAFRRPEMADRLQVFEVDHPATQKFKRSRIAELNWKFPSNLHFVPIDFAGESLAEALARTPYDPESKSFFSWLGVTYYLPPEVIFDTLRSITDIAPAGSMIVFDYFDKNAFDPEKADKGLRAEIDFMHELGQEIMTTGLEPSELAADIPRLGLRLRENLYPHDIQRRYFRENTGFNVCKHLHLALAVVE